MDKLHYFKEKLHGKIKTIKLTTPSAIIIGSCIISLSIIFSNPLIRGISSPSITGGSLDGNNDGLKENIFRGSPIGANDFSDGNTKSKVVVIEYSDPECPFCVKAHTTMKQLRNEYADKITFVYRHFPLTQLHPNAFDESRAIACAGTVGGKNAFYEYIDALYGFKYSSQDPNTLRFSPLSQDGKETIAKNIGLNITKFSLCMNEQKTKEIVDNSIEDGASAGVNGTPTTFVLLKNDKGYEIVAPINGAQPIEYFKAAIEEALSK